MLIILCVNGCNKNYGNENERLKIITIHSEVLNKDMISHIYLPDNYDSNIKYPVLYFLPSNGGSSYTVINKFGIIDSANRLISNNQIEQVIIVALGIDNSFGINTGTETKTIVTSSEKSFDEGMYEDYIINEAISYIDKNFSNNTSKEARYIGGYSMGGMAALHIKNVSAIERGLAGISVPALKRICETLSVSSDTLIMSEAESICADRLDFLVERLKRLPPQQLDLALEMINKLFEAFAM